MSNGNGNFALLLDLAKETSSEKRRDLLRQVTDAFVADDHQRTDSEAAIFDEIFDKVAVDLEAEVRAELSNKIADSSAPLGRTARRLALDKIEIARPVIERSKALSQEDLVEVINQKGSDHMMAVTKRDDISEKVSSALVDKGEDKVVASLLENNTAKINRETFERVADRAQDSEILQGPLVRNQLAPLDLLNEVYLKAEQGLRREIMRKFHGVSPAELEKALEASRNRLSSAYGALPEDYQAANEHIESLAKSNKLAAAILPGLLRDNRRTEFSLGLSKLAEVDFPVVYRMVETEDMDAIATLCKGAEFERGIFVTICMLFTKGDSNRAQAEQFGNLYEQVSVAAAQRALRFWKVRSKTNAKAA